MKQTIFKAVLIFLMLSPWWMTGCNDSDDPSLANVRMEIKAKSELGVIDPSARVMNASIIFEEVLMGVREIEFEGLNSNDEDDDEGWDDDGSDDDGDDDSGDDRTADDDLSDDDMDDDDEIEFEGRFVVDMIRGTSTPDFGIADVIPGTYSEIEIESGPFLEDNNTLFIAFDYQDGGDVVSIEYSTRSSFEIEIENYRGIRLDGGNLVQILVLLDLDKLIAGIDFNSAEADADGIVRINSNSNSTLAATISSRIKKAFDAGEDRDGDDDIDDDDDDDDDDD